MGRSLFAVWRWPVLLTLLTFVSTLYVGAGWAGVPVRALGDLWHGWTFAVPLMAILIAHEMGHYVVGRRHGVDISPPFFIPMPAFLLGTLGAVIRIRKPITERNALLDVGVAGPLAGLVIALPVLWVGLVHSEIRPRIIPSGDKMILEEGHSLLYSAFLYLTKGSIPPSHDIWLSPTALAGWAGLLVTMINLIPVAQLDGGHIAYALWGKVHNRTSRWIRRLLPLFGVAVSAVALLPAYSRGVRGEPLLNHAMSGVHWIVWSFALWLMTRGSKVDHPPTDLGPLSPKRRIVGYFTLALFALLFMPVWLRQAS